jgi:hypothetical protein
VEAIPSSDTFAHRWRIGRLQIELCLVRHRYVAASDRWVFQPSFIYDRPDSRASSTTGEGE